MSELNSEQLDRTDSGIPEPVLRVLIGAMALALSAAGAVLDATAFWPAYLVALEFWLGVSLGCLGIALLHSITGGGWGRSIARNLRAGTAALIVGAIGILPLWWGASVLYPGAEIESSGILSSHQKQYFAMRWQISRTIVYLTAWGGMGAWIVNSYRSQHLPSPRKAALLLVLFWLVTTFAVVDGIMALMPDWPSTLFPMMSIVGYGVLGLAMMIVLRSADARQTADEFTGGQSHDLGNLLQAFNMVWVYLAFSQYLIIWSGDLPYEVRWYMERAGSVGTIVIAMLVLLHFAVPFGLLLSRDLKRDPRKLAAVAALLLVVHLAVLAWQTLPSTDAALTWAVFLTVTNTIVLGVIWLACFHAMRRSLPEFASDQVALETDHTVPARGETS